MKKNLLVKIISSLLVISFIPNLSQAQVTSNYVLSPGPAWTLPTGSTMDLSIIWIDPDGQIHEGVNEYVNNVEPLWTINGKQTYNSNPADGRLTLNPDKTKPTTYTAPDKIPFQNPVTIAVRFKTNDSSKEETTLMCNVKIVNAPKKWYISYTCSSYEFNSQTGDEDEFTDESHAIGNASMIVDAAAPEASGYTSIHTGEGDSVIESDVSGNWEEHRKHISRESGVVVEKIVRNFSGKATKNIGIEFVYDPAPDGGVTLNSGINFDQTGNEKFWRLDYDSRSLKLVDSDNPSSSSGYNLGIGLSSDIVKRTKHGFTIDNSQSKDTSYTILGEKHLSRSGLQYHVTITWMNANKLPGGKGKKD